MSTIVIVCARCATANQASSRFCSECELPLGAVRADAGAAFDALGPHEAPDPSEPSADAALRSLVSQSGYQATSFGSGWRLMVPLEQERGQAVYVGQAGPDPEGRSMLELVTVCAPANDRDARTLLKLNARLAEGRFAIKVLRGEEYFVVTANITAESVTNIDCAGLIGRIARLADGLEARLSRGGDIY